MQKETPANAVGKPGEELADAAGRVVGAARGLADRTSALTTEARALAERKTEDLTTWVRERPLAGLLIAFGVGYLLGRIARR